MMMNNIMWKVGAYSDLTRWDIIATACVIILLWYWGRNANEE